MNEEQALIPRTSITEMVAAYRQAEQEIRAGFALVLTAEQRLREAFAEGYSFTVACSSRNRTVQFDDPDEVMHAMKHAAWKALIDKMGIRSAMSIKRAQELDEQLEGRSNRYGVKVEPLPEITESNILAMMEQTALNIPQMIEEATKEVFDWLRPHKWGLEYKTNQKSEWELKDKIIQGWCVRKSYHQRGGFEVIYTSQQNLTALDNVFSMLDGKGVIKTTKGPLTDAIYASQDGTGETDYFAFKCFRNGNLHLKFKRMDLVSKLNAVAGGMRLKDARQAA